MEIWTKGILYLFAYLCFSSRAKADCTCGLLRDLLEEVNTAVTVVNIYLSTCKYDDVVCHDTELKNCDGLVHTSSEDTLYASGDPSDTGICRIMYPTTGPTYDRYEFTAYLASSNTGTDDKGNPGLLFNIQDQDNYDFVFFRIDPSPNETCIQHGYMEGGLINMCDGADCTSPISSESYFEAKLEVAYHAADPDNKVNIFIKGNAEWTTKSHYPSRGVVGIMALNGHENSVRFKDIALEGRTTKS